ncbi:MAG: minor capsid protein [Candidatus Izemoplasmatales bacterium]|nr:minor capsid protein [Candidatus Izemoplasmatales bacterium]
MPKVPEKSYWEKRSELTLIQNEKSALQYEKDLKNAYQATIKQITKEIEAFYGRYAKENKISLADARKRLTPNELIDFNKQSKIYLDEVERLGDKAFTAEYRSYLKELSGKAYVSRLEELTANIRHNLETLATGYNTGLGQTLTEAYQDGFYRTMFDIQKQAKLGVSFTAPGGKQLETAIRERWLGQNYSERIWADKNRMLMNLEQTLSQEFVRGRNPREVSKDFADKMNTSYHNAQRLIRTELNYISNKGSMKAYKESEVVDQYQYLATLDSRTSDICSEMDGKIFDLKEGKVGINLPPLHPHCRSTTIPYFEDNEIEDRVARDEDGKGKSRKLGKDVTFFEWVEQYGSPKYKKRVEVQRKRFEELNEPPIKITFESIEDNLINYVGGGYGSVKDAITVDEFQFIKANMKETSQPLYRVEDSRFTYENIEVGETFEFIGDVRSFTRNRNNYLDKMLKEGIDEDIWQEPIVFETVGKVKHFDMDRYAANYYEDQSESLIGGKFEVVGEELKEIGGIWITVVKIKSV